jgi:hypothetical protein
MKPSWWQLYGIGLLLVLMIGVIDAAIPAGGLCTLLESAVVVLAFGLMLAWRRHNRRALELGRHR